MEITCECGKILHADGCGFHNDNYKDILLFLCPYCGVKTTAFVSPPLEETPSTREIMPGLVPNQASYMNVSLPMSLKQPPSEGGA